MLRSRKPMRRTKLAPISPKRKSRTGKEGITRLRGEDMSETRHEVFIRAGGYCQMRDILIAEISEREDMAPDHKSAAIDGIRKRCWEWASENHGHDAHLQNKRNHGDLTSGRVWSCRPCHIEADHNFYGKPVPPKARMA